MPGFICDLLGIVDEEILSICFYQGVDIKGSIEDKQGAVVPCCSSLVTLLS